MSSDPTSPAAIGIANARKRLDRAAKAVVALHAQTHTWDVAGVEEEWSNFLHAASDIYEKVGQALKDNSKGRPWFGQVINFRKTDELMRYIHFARNSEHHGIADSTEAHDGMEMWPASPNVKIIRDEKGKILRTEFPADIKENDPIVKMLPPGARLVTVTDTRHSVSCPPPTVHQGLHIPDGSPLGVAQQALIYLSWMIDQAETYLD